MKTKTYFIKNVPEPVLNYFYRNYPESKGYSYKFYCYYNFDKTIKYFGCIVYKDGELWSYSDQGTENDFKNYAKVYGINEI